MKKSIFAAVAAATLATMALPSVSNADQLHIGIGVNGGGVGYGYPHDYGMHRGWMRHGCHWVRGWHHHHPVMIKVCGGGHWNKY